MPSTGVIEGRGQVWYDPANARWPADAATFTPPPGGFDGYAFQDVAAQGLVQLLPPDNTPSGSGGAFGLQVDGTLVFWGWAIQVETEPLGYPAWLAPTPLPTFATSIQPLPLPLDPGHLLAGSNESFAPPGQNPNPPPPSTWDQFCLTWTGLLALKDGQLWRYGTNVWGELGYQLHYPGQMIVGEDRYRALWYQVPVPAGVTPARLIDHTFSYLSGFVDAQGQLYLAGENDYGQMGQGTYQPGEQDSFQRVAIPDAYTVLQASLRFTGAAVCTDGSVWVWGAQTPQVSNGGVSYTDAAPPTRLMLPGGGSSVADDTACFGQPAFDIVWISPPIPPGWTSIEWTGTGLTHAGVAQAAYPFGASAPLVLTPTPQVVGQPRAGVTWWSFNAGPTTHVVITPTDAGGQNGACYLVLVQPFGFVNLTSDWCQSFHLLVTAPMPPAPAPAMRQVASPFGLGGEQFGIAADSTAVYAWGGGATDLSAAPHPLAGLPPGVLASQIATDQTHGLLVLGSDQLLYEYAPGSGEPLSVVTDEDGTPISGLWVGSGMLQQWLLRAAPPRAAGVFMAQLVG